MISYAELKEKPKEILAATGLRVNDFHQLLPRLQEKLTEKQAVAYRSAQRWAKTRVFKALNRSESMPSSQKI